MPSSNLQADSASGAPRPQQSLYSPVGQEVTAEDNSDFSSEKAFRWRPGTFQVNICSVHQFPFAH